MLFYQLFCSGANIERAHRIRLDCIVFFFYINRNQKSVLFKKNYRNILEEIVSLFKNERPKGEKSNQQEDY